MLTALTIKDYYSNNRKRHISFKRDKVKVEVVKYNRLNIVHITYYKYGKAVRWNKIKELTGNESNNILCNKSIIFPPESGLKRYTTNLLKERIVENTVVEILKKIKEPTENLEIGLYDPNGRKMEFLENLLEYTGKIIVVTNSLDEYQKIYKQIMIETGAVIIFKRDVSAFSNCDIVISPQKICKELPLKDTAIIFTAKNPSVCQRVRVYSKYIVALNENYKEIKPNSLSDEYFAQALYDKGRQYSIGSVLPILCMSEGLNSTIEEISNFIEKRL